MDYVPAHGDTTKLDDRDEISGARVFDGEDQGKYSAHTECNPLSSVLPHLLARNND